MCEKCQNNQAFMNGVLIGGLVGAALGVLYAPQSGKETRKKVKEAAITIKEKSEPIFEEVEERVMPILKEIEQASEPVRQEFVEKINELVDEVEGKIREEKKVLKKKVFSKFDA